MAEIRSTSTQVTTEQQTAFTKAEADRSASFNSLVTDHHKQLQTSLNDMATKTEQAVLIVKRKVKADEDKVAAARTRVEEILGIVGEEALVGDYSNNAINERKSADLWRWIATGSIAFAIITALIFTATINDTTSWQHAIAKLTIVLSFGGLAGYAAKQSSEHRSAQRGAEQMALQLKALKPYLSDIDDKAKRDELLFKIADRLFGQVQLIVKGKTKKGNAKNENPLLTMQLVGAAGAC